MRATQIEKIITLMIRRKNVQEWFYAPDFQRPDLTEDTYVGYEASARMSDLMREYPEMVEWKREGKYRYIRFRFENIQNIMSSLNVPRELKDLIGYELRKVENRLI